MAITKLDVIAIPKNARARAETGPNPIPAIVHSITCPQCLDGVSVLQIIFPAEGDVHKILNEFLKLHRRYHALVGKGSSKVTAEEELELVRILDRVKQIKKDMAIIADYYDIRGNPPAAAMRA